MSRQEHQRHSPACHFIALKKPVEELTLEELMKLQKERQKFLIVSVLKLLVKCYTITQYNGSPFQAAFHEH